MEETKPLSKHSVSTDTRPFLECLVEFLDSTGGRDKVNTTLNQFYRLVQYTIKLLSPLLKNKKNLEGVTVFLDNLGDSFGLTRKVLG
jgi:hypothetical protein